MKNRFYALHSNDDQEDSLDVVTSILQVYSINVYDSLDLFNTLSFVTHLVTMKFDVLPDVLCEPCSVISHVGDSVISQ